jgi:hypothetical protein
MGNRESAREPHARGSRRSLVRSEVVRLTKVYPGPYTMQTFRFYAAFQTIIKL